MKYKDKVLIVGPLSPPMGGIATYVDDMLKSDLNIEYDILYLNTARSFTIKKSLVMNFVLISKNSLKLVHLLLFHKPKIVHIHTSSYLAFWEKSFFLIISKIFAKKTVLHIHGGGFKNFYQSQMSFLRFFIRYCLNLSDIIIVLSNFWKEFFVQIADSEKISVIPNAVDFNLYEVTQNQNSANDSFTQILFAGYLSKDKGIYDILDSVMIVVKKHKNIKFCFAGSEEKLGELDFIKKRIIKNDIENYVHFLGVLSKKDMISLYKKSDLFILPSYTEGMPMTILEAMATGLPIISTPVGAIPEIIEEEINGFLVTPGDHVDLANKIIKLIESPDLRKKIRIHNQEKIKKQYDWKIIANKISNLYLDLLIKN